MIWQPTAPNNWVPVLRALEGAPGLWSDIVIRTGNIDSGPNDELVSGVRVVGTGGYLSVSVVDIRSSKPRVMAVYNDVPKGIAVLRSNSGVELWSGTYLPADAVCCPSSFQKIRITASGGNWSVTPGSSLPTGDPGIPASEF